MSLTLFNGAWPHKSNASQHRVKQMPMQRRKTRKYARTKVKQNTNGHVPERKTIKKKKVPECATLTRHKRGQMSKVNAEKHHSIFTIKANAGNAAHCSFYLFSLTSFCSLSHSEQGNMQRRKQKPKKRVGTWHVSRDEHVSTGVPLKIVCMQNPQSRKQKERGTEQRNTCKEREKKSRRTSGAWQTRASWGIGRMSRRKKK